jgi:acyl-CoA thioesterase-2
MPGARPKSGSAARLKQHALAPSRGACYPLRPVTRDNPTADDLLEKLDLEEIDYNIFRGQNESGRQVRLFGGQVAAQALVAAGRTVEKDAGFAHSLHGYFLRPGDPSAPVIYSVDRIRDGRSFTTRRVVAQQRGKAIFNMSVSFHCEESGYEHQMAIPAVLPPEQVPTLGERVRQMWEEVPEDVRRWADRPRLFDIRHLETPTYLGGPASSGPGYVWMRAQAELEDDPLLHQCLLTYASDISLLDNMERPHGRWGPLGPLMTASLDHALWFHRPLRADEWLLFAQDSPAAAGARGLARGSIYKRDGTLVASVVQEGLMRPAKQPEDRAR